MLLKGACHCITIIGAIQLQMLVIKGTALFFMNEFAAQPKNKSRSHKDL